MTFVCVTFLERYKSTAIAPLRVESEFFEVCAVIYHITVHSGGRKFGQVLCQVTGNDTTTTLYAHEHELLYRRFSV